MHAAPESARMGTFADRSILQLSPPSISAATGFVIRGRHALIIHIRSDEVIFA